MPERDRVSCRAFRDSVTQPTRRICVRRPLKAQQFLRCPPALSLCLIGVQSVAWPLIALLKDADGLDRVRLGDLDPRYLRHPESKGMVPFAQALFDATDGVIATGPAHFEELMVAATRLS